MPIRKDSGIKPKLLILEKDENEKPNLCRSLDLDQGLDLYLCQTQFLAWNLDLDSNSTVNSTSAF